MRIRAHVDLMKGFLAVALILIEIGFHTVPTVSAQQGFLSIACGTTPGVVYLDESNSLTWVSDNGTYMTIGNTIQQPSAEYFNLQSLRYFPEGRSKYCYNLSNVDTSFPYLVRASFYMNASLLNETSPFQFSLSVDANNWFTLTSGDGSASDLLIVQEGIFHPPNSVMNICLQPVVGNPFISSLELRQLDPDMYSYEGGNSQYLYLAYRYNCGAAYPDVRYPDDPYDRIWTSSGSGIQTVSNLSSDNTISNYSSEVYYVPVKVMQEAWVLPDNVDFGYYFPVYDDGPQLYPTIGDSVFVIVYAENVNTSVSQAYNMTVALAWDRVAQLTVSDQADALKYPYLILKENNLVFSAQSSNPDYSPVINAIETYAQYTYNKSTTNSADVQVINSLQIGFSLSDWQGDPCTPVPNDWLSCNLNNPVLGKRQEPCGLNGSSASHPAIKQCNEPQNDFYSKYYVTSVNISDRPSSGLSDMLASQQSTLSALSELSITNSGVDNATFQFLINFTSDALILLNLSHNTLTGVVSPFENVPFFGTLQYLNLSYNSLSSLPTTWKNTTQNLTVLDLSHNQLQGDISALDLWVDINSNSLQELYLSNNSLGGTFSSDLYFSGFQNLTIAYFDQNSIQGTLNLSKWYAALQDADDNLGTSSVTLQLFSFVNNNISNIVPRAEDFDSTIRNLIKKTNQSFINQGILLGGNPYCRSPNSYIYQYLCRSSADHNIEEKNHNNDTVILIISLCTGILGLLFICVMFTILWKLRKQVSALREIQQALLAQKVQPPFYQYSDLKVATRDFHKDNKLGHGGFGIVYKGVLADGTALAVKQLFNSRGLQVLDEFLNEVVLITGIKHKNLIQLKGCCIKDKQRMLVYEYAERGNLAEALWGSKAYGALSWEQRFKICVGVARGLSYLHEELQPCIIHRDIKPENILLDSNFNPKIADFGLARYLPNDATHARATSNIAGTVGYFAPEYVMQGQLSEKIDVYSYGILILEVVSGRKCIDLSRPDEEKFLRNWVDIMRNKNLLIDILQPELRENCVMTEVDQAIHIGLLCVQNNPERRPTMSQVVTMFLGNMDVSGFPNESPNESDSPYFNFNFNNLLRTIDHGSDYPTLQIIEEDSSVFPLLDQDSPSLLSSSSRGSRSTPLLELSRFSGR